MALLAISTAYIKHICLLALLLICSGCATHATVSESERDRSGQYDGTWRVIIKGRAGTQFGGNSTFRCNKLDWKYYLNIKDGKGTASMGYGTKNVKLNISPEGTFNIHSDTKYHWSQNQPIVVALSGKLGESTGTGHYTIGMKPYYGTGCRYKTVFKRI